MHDPKHEKGKCPDMSIKKMKEFTKKGGQK
jgi:hypothetical protein